MEAYILQHVLKVPFLMGAVIIYKGGTEERRGMEFVLHNFFIGDFRPGHATVFILASNLWIYLQIMIIGIYLVSLFI
jgi:hypothetical protein